MARHSFLWLCEAHTAVLACTPALCRGGCNLSRWTNPSPIMRRFVSPCPKRFHIVIAFHPLLRLSCFIGCHSA